METSEIEVPLAESLANELVDFWERTFGALDDDFRGLLTGADQAQNRHLVYLARKGTSLAGTCHLTIGRSSKHLGGLARIDHRFGNEGDFGRPERFSESFAIDPVQVE